MLIDMESFTGRTYYDILDIEPASDLRQIKTAYKSKLLSNHPDKSEKNETEINSIQQAYKVLSDNDLRSEYDEELKKKVQIQGFNISGEGLDIYNLEDFHEKGPDWVFDCPRCESIESIRLSEDDLINCGTDDGQGGYEIVTQCGDCSLWIKVQYSEADDEDE